MKRIFRFLMVCILLLSMVGVVLPVFAASDTPEDTSGEETYADFSDACSNLQISAGATVNGNAISTYCCDGAAYSNLVRVPPAFYASGIMMNISYRSYPNGYPASNGYPNLPPGTPVGYIPQVANTYGYIGNDVYYDGQKCGGINQFGLTIGETTTSDRSQLNGQCWATTLTATAAAGQANVVVDASPSSSIITPGQSVVLTDPTTNLTETAVIASVAGKTVTMTAPLTNAYTSGSTIGGGPLLYAYSSFANSSLMTLVLMRAKTAVEANNVMGGLADQYGYSVGGGWGPENITINDGTSVWDFEIDPVPAAGGYWTAGQPVTAANCGALWCSARVPDGQVAISCNVCRISGVPIEDAGIKAGGAANGIVAWINDSDPKNANYMFSPNILAVAEKMGWYSPGTQASPTPFVWNTTYSTSHTATRIGEFFHIVAPSQYNGTETDAPFSVTPDATVFHSGKLSVSDVMSITNDNYQGTQYDITQNAAFNSKVVTTTTTAAAAVGATNVVVSSVTSFAAGEFVTLLDVTTNATERAIIASVTTATKTLTMTAPLKNIYTLGSQVMTVLNSQMLSGAAAAGQPVVGVTSTITAGPVFSYAVGETVVLKDLGTNATENAVIASISGNNLTMTVSLINSYSVNSTIRTVTAPIESAFAVQYVPSALSTLIGNLTGASTPSARRSIGTTSSVFSYISEVNPNLPDPVKGCYWYTPWNANTGCYVPIYCGTTQIPDTWGNTNRKAIDPDCAYTIFKEVNGMTLNYAYQTSIGYVNNVRNPAENLFSNEQAGLQAAVQAIYADSNLSSAQALLKAQALVTAYDNARMNATLSAYSSLVTYLMYRDFGVTPVPSAPVVTPLAQSSAADILMFSVPGEVGTANVNAATGTIDIKIQPGSDVTNLIATFTTSPAIQSIQVGSTVQVSGTTANNFTTPVVYTVISEDGTIIKNWTVTVEPSFVYNFIGFSSPSNNATFKAGSTIPMGWQVKDSDGNIISDLSSVVSLMVGPVGGTLVAPISNGNTKLRFDNATNQFVFNWQTKGLSSGNYSIQLTLLDATVHAIQITLK